eukprot:12913487-Prorocentrum_lima.AAC.1
MVEANNEVQLASRGGGGGESTEVILHDYANDYDARSNGVPYKGLYRTGDMVKTRALLPEPNDVIVNKPANIYFQ